MIRCIRPTDRILLAVAGEGAPLLAAGAQAVRPLAVRVLDLAAARRAGYRHHLAPELAQGLAGSGAHSETLTIVTGCGLTDLLWLADVGAHPIVCPPVEGLRAIEERLAPRWVWGHHRLIGQHLARTALRDLDNGLATTWQPPAVQA